jgi:sugar O-acyltransferase (sialic acid O-acetyltransferase NeuD family)
MAGLIVAGSGSRLFSDLLEVLREAGYPKLSPIFSFEKQSPQFGSDTRLSASKPLSELQGLPYVIAVASPGIRHLLWRQAVGQRLVANSAILHPSASYPETLHPGEGSIVSRLVSIGVGVEIGKHVLVNRSASIGHDVVLESFATLQPSATLTGSVRVESGAIVGAGAVCLPDVTVGENSVVGAGAVVTRNVPPRSVVVGNPGKVIREIPSGFDGFVVPPSESLI